MDRSKDEEIEDPRARLNLRRVINASGTMTALGASAAAPEAIEAAGAILPWFVEIAELQRRASEVIAKVTGAEAGMITASASAGLTLAVAAAMTGADLARIERLPDASEMRNRVAIQLGHLINYGAPLDQAIRLAGASVVPVGEATTTDIGRLATALDGAAAAIYVVSHHVMPYPQIPLGAFIETCADRRVPVIVDAASEYDLTGFISAGANLVVYSAHKFLGGLTAGIVAGRKDLVRAAYLQNGGIGRGMKVGKEGIAGAMAALEAWGPRDHAADRRREEECVAVWLQRLQSVPGIRAELSPDPTGNPMTRLRLRIGPESGATAWNLADALAAGPRPVIVRDDEAESGSFELDPCNLRAGEAEEVAERLLITLAAAQRGDLRRTSFEAWRENRLHAYLAWPDEAAPLP